MKAISDNPIVKYFERLKKSVFLVNLNAAFASTITKLEIAFTNVSTVLIVNESPRVTIMIDKNSV